MESAPFVPPPGNPRFRHIDGIRALAALAVLVFHVGSFSQVNRYAWYGAFTSHLDVGVAIFFAISGFVLYRPFLVARHGGRRRPLADYAIGRVLRLAPAYWLVLTVAAIAPGLAGVFSDHWWMYYGLLQTYFPGHQADGLPVAWSLVVEVAFYALLPLYAFALHGLARSRLRRLETPVELAALAVLAAGSVTAQRVASGDTIVSTFDWFSGGMALAVVSVAVARRPAEPAWVRVLVRRPWLPWAGALACWLTICVGLGLSRDPAIGNPDWKVVATRALCIPIGTLVLAPVVFAREPRGLGARLLASRPAAWLGLVSYGIYLWHWPVLTMIWKHGWSGVVAGHTLLSYAVIGTPLSIALAAASWYCVERPALAARRRLRFRPRPVAPVLDGSASLEACPEPPPTAAR